MKSERSCEDEGFEAGYSFALKALLKEKTYLLLFINFSLSVILFALAVRSFER